MLMQVARDPNGTAQAPLQVMRTSPGGPDNGQTYRTFQGKAALAAGGLTVNLGTVPAGKTWYVTDLELDLASSFCDVSIQAGAVPVWQRLLQTALGIAGVGRSVPLTLQAGAAATLVFGAPGAGTPNGYWVVGILEQ